MRQKTPINTKIFINIAIYRTLGIKDTKKKVVIVGGGIAGLVASCYLAQHNFEVRLIEKNAHLGGRIRSCSSQKFTFDMGPSWYWMKEVFEGFYKDFGKKQADFYPLLRLDPSYRSFFKNQTIDLPVDLEERNKVFQQIDSECVDKLAFFLSRAKKRYQLGLEKFMHYPSLSLAEYLNFHSLKYLFHLGLFHSIKKEIKRVSKQAIIQRLLEFPSLFIGGPLSVTPALFSLMNYADINGGSWYPMGGMYKIVDAFSTIAQELKVKIHLNEQVQGFELQKKKIYKIISDKGTYPTDYVICNADYHFIEQTLLDKKYRSYSAKFWKKQKTSPSCLIWYLGINKKISGLSHHNLFLDQDAQAFYKYLEKKDGIPENPLFYVCCSSKTDSKVAPDGCENLFILMPVNEGFQDTEKQRAYFLDIFLDRISKKTKEKIDQSNILVKKCFSSTDFQQDYHALKKNAYGLSNLFWQLAIFRPRMKSKKIKNLYFCGHLTVPGGGVPPSMISGKMAAKMVIKKELK